MTLSQEYRAILPLWLVLCCRLKFTYYASQRNNDVNLLQIRVLHRCKRARNHSRWRGIRERRSDALMLRFPRWINQSKTFCPAVACCLHFSFVRVVAKLRTPFGRPTQVSRGCAAENAANIARLDWLLPSASAFTYDLGIGNKLFFQI